MIRRKDLLRAALMFDAIYVEASEPGEILCLDCFYVGKLEGVGNVWQITACDAASSFGWARVFIGDPRATVAVILLPHSGADARIDRRRSRRRMKSREERERMSRPMRNRTSQGAEVS
jgi:hypothetical protein